MIYVYWHKPKIVFQGRIASSTVISYPQQYLDVDRYIIGTPNLIQIGQTLLLGTYAGGSDLGRVRIKSLTSTNTIYPAWAEQGIHDGELTVSAGSYVTILREYRLWAKIPRIVVNPDPTILPLVYMDSDIVSGSYPTNPPPVANVGPNEAGSPDPVTGKYEVSFDVNDSFQFNTSGGWGAISNGRIQWGFDGGTVISGSATSRQAVVRYSPGEYSISLDVQSDAGVWHRARKVLFVRDPATNADVLPHQIVSHSQTPKGQEMSIKFFQNMDLDTYRDGSMILVWEEDPNPSSQVKNRMIFCGWHLSDESTLEHQRTALIGDSTFRFADICRKLENTPGFSQEMNYNGAGAPTAVGTWNLTPYNNILFYLTFLLQWQSTALEVSDLIIDNYILPLLNFLRLTSDADNLYNQVNKLANMMVPDFYLTCTQLGQMRLSVDVGLMVLSDRPNFAPYQGIISSLDWESITIDNRRFPRVAELMSGAIKGSSVYVYDGSNNLIIDTFWCIAPGKTTRGQGAEFQQSTNHLVDDQYTLNYVEGNRYARLNSPYGDIRIVVAWQLNQYKDMDPGTMGRIEVWFQQEDPPRPTLDDSVFAMIKEISTSYDYQRTAIVRTLTFTLEVETSGPPAITISKPPGINI
jgi:hypothetical protein